MLLIQLGYCHRITKIVTKNKSERELPLGADHNIHSRGNGLLILLIPNLFTEGLLFLNKYEIFQEAREGGVQMKDHPVFFHALT